jgi:hypothetical protein
MRENFDYLKTHSFSRWTVISGVGLCRFEYVGLYHYSVTSLDLAA